MTCLGRDDVIKSTTRKQFNNYYTFNQTLILTMEIVILTTIIRRYKKNFNPN